MNSAGWIRKLSVQWSLAIIGILVTQRGIAQVNISGKPGLLNIPTARVLSDGTFHIGYHYNPSHYDPRSANPNARNPDSLESVGSSNSIFYATLAILPRLEVNINIFRVNGYIPLNERGIGDRQFDIKYAVLTERERRPSVAMVVSAPFGIDNSLVTYAAMATKNFTLSENVTAEVTAGFGSPYYFDRSDNVGNDYNIFTNYKLHNKNDRPNPYLSGPFGGIALRFKQNLGGMLEWDSRHLNVGAYAKLFERWTLQAGVINFDQITFGTSYAVSLRKLPKRLSQQTAIPK
ncbi:YjbH domain-containing protein [Spirosoma validum]|uniref:YjbH domain-containing protein n=1 Tax=Spirosoma validum TaxID=2771355 RepID=A0A927GD81_9BACT|nr:YjbH domain-containing protein [Spirosoma validum]MBD2753295.1 YjbH domain-containing protein [Spirosoma validum]